MSAHENELIHSLRAAAPDARDRIAEQFYPRVRELVHRKLASDFRRKNRWMPAAFSTGDIVHEVFLRVLPNLDQFEGDDERALVHYLATCVQNRLLDLVRYHGAARRDVQQRFHGQQQPNDANVDDYPGDEPTPTHHLIAREHIDIYRATLGTFSERHEQLLRQRLEDGCSFAEIARRLDYATANVACKAYHEVLARLLVRLRERGVHLTLGDTP